MMANASAPALFLSLCMWFTVKLMHLKFVTSAPCGVCVCVLCKLTLWKLLSQCFHSGLRISISGNQNVTCPHSFSPLSFSHTNYQDNFRHTSVMWTLPRTALWNAFTNVVTQWGIYLTYSVFILSLRVWCWAEEITKNCVMNWIKLWNRLFFRFIRICTGYFAKFKHVSDK